MGRPPRRVVHGAGERRAHACAKDAYRRRLAEIEEDTEAARGVGDVEREEQADAERDFLIRELSSAVRLGGLTVGQLADREGKIYEGRIEPDEEVEGTVAVQRPIEWLISPVAR